MAEFFPRSSHTLLAGFPIPRLLSFASAGLEISEHSLKHLSFAGRNKLTLQSFGNCDLKPDIIAHGEIQDPAALSEDLRTFLPSVGTPYVHVSLPEQKGYVFRMMIPRDGELSMKDAVEFRIEENIPLPPSDIIFDCEELAHESTETDRAVNVTAFPRSTVEMYYAALADAGFVPLSFEIESQAAARALLPHDDMQARMMVDFGETRTVIAIAERGVVRFTTSLEVAGNTLAFALRKSGIVDAAEIERLKNDVGIASQTQGDKTASLLLPTIEQLKDEINRHFVYWRTHGETSGSLHLPITSVVLSGGNANLKGITEYLSNSMRVPVTLAEVWQNAFTLADYIPEIPYKQSLRYATVIGLALRRGIQNT